MRIPIPNVIEPKTTGHNKLIKEENNLRLSRLEDEWEHYFYCVLLCLLWFVIFFVVRSSDRRDLELFLRIQLPVCYLLGSQQIQYKQMHKSELIQCNGGMLHSCLIFLRWCNVIYNPGMKKIKWILICSK